MAEMIFRSFPFNSEIFNGSDDRLYDADDWAGYFSEFVGDGVYPNPSTNLDVVSLYGTMTLTVLKGSAFIKGRRYPQIENIDIPFQPAAANYDRIDSIVVQLDNTARLISVVYKPGTPAPSPLPVELVRNDDIYEVRLAEIRVLKGVASIATQYITKTKLDKTVCGIVSNVVESVDTTTLYEQMEDYMLSKQAQINSQISTNQTSFTNQLSTQQTTHSNQISSHETEHDNQVSSHGIEHNSQITAHETEHDNQIAQHQTQIAQEHADWTAQYNDQSSDFGVFFASAQDSLPQYASFDIDNLSAYPGAKHDVTFTTTVITETLVNKLNPAIKIANQTTTFNPNGSITKEQTVYKTDGFTVLRHTIVTTVFNPNGSITETNYTKSITK